MTQYWMKFPYLKYMAIRNSNATLVLNVFGNHIFTRMNLSIIFFFYMEKIFIVGLWKEPVNPAQWLICKGIQSPDLQWN